MGVRVVAGRRHWPSLSSTQKLLTAMSYLTLGFILILFGGPVAGYIYWDASRRKASVRTWCALGLIFSVLALPFYWANRPLREGESRSKSKLLAVLKGFGALWSYFIGSMVIRLLIDTGFTWEAFIGTIVLAGVWVLPFWLGRGPLFLIGVTTTTEKEYGPTGPLAKTSDEGRPLVAG